jgi:hypothetical protein
VQSFSVADSSAVFAIKVAEGDNALAFYPGKFDKTDLRLAFQFDSSHVSSDISFKLLQVDKGTSGKNMTYKLVVSLMPPLSGALYNFVNIGSALSVAATGCDKIDSLSYGDVGPERYVIDNIFAAQGGAADMTAATTINVADLIKTKNPSFTAVDFSKKRIIIAIIGEASEAATAGTYHPIVALDDIKVNYWINWYQATNLGLAESGSLPPASIRDVAFSAAKIIGKKGQIDIIDAQSAVTIYTLTGQKVGTLLNKGRQSISVPAGVYLVTEPNRPTTKVIVK